MNKIKSYCKKYIYRRPYKLGARYVKAAQVYKDNKYVTKYDF